MQEGLQERAQRITCQEHLPVMAEVNRMIIPWTSQPSTSVNHFGIICMQAGISGGRRSMNMYFHFSRLIQRQFPPKDQTWRETDKTESYTKHPTQYHLLKEPLQRRLDYFTVPLPLNIQWIVLNQSHHAFLVPFLTMGPESTMLPDACRMFDSLTLDPTWYLREEPTQKQKELGSGYMAISVAQIIIKKKNRDRYWKSS